MKISSVCLMLCANLVVLTCGCAHRPKPKQGIDAAHIDYSLPFTHVQLTARLVLSQCGSAPKAKAEVTLAPVASASPYPVHTRRIEGEQLVSFSKKRDLKIELHPHRAIKSINASVADRSGAIVINALKIATLLPGAPSPDSRPAISTCNAATENALNRYTALKSQIKRLRDDLGKNPAATMKQIDALAAELGRIESGPLTLTLSKLLTIDVKQSAGLVSWTEEDLSKWLESKADRSNFNLAWCVADWEPGASSDCLIDTAKPQYETYVSTKKIDPDNWVSPPKCSDEACATTLVFLEPKLVELTVVSANFVDAQPDPTIPIEKTNRPKAEPDLVGGTGGSLARVTFPLPQAGDYSYFPLSAGFGGSKSLALTLDEFGRRTSFGWSSGARGEEITGGVQAIAEARTAFQAARATADVKEDKAAIEALEALQKRNKLEACRAIIEAGGYTCPDS
ncbi:hypothetical protein MMG85_09665 [Pseudoxanthomonas sp. LH2527]|uniref:hypothetical protein n=1 Tax=Pseudoxanthomonas sp. LH2527 TaxID=2923249 RepID=UPI001F1481C5|nr:hypothetical protein [Pseudoxanthomonas sp. LH2527]MCH6483830.1 hypothetical protein [Pseudoxanthomonas sp. LH2527]